MLEGLRAAIGANDHEKVYEILMGNVRLLVNPEISHVKELLLSSPTICNEKVTELLVKYLKFGNNDIRDFERHLFFSKFFFNFRKIWTFTRRSCQKSK